MNQQGHRSTCGAFRHATVPGTTRDIQVSPLESIREFFEELRCGDGPTGTAATDIGDIGEV